MFSLNKKPVVINVFALVLPVLLFCTGLFVPAHSESQPRSVLLHYIKDLYYATSIKQLSKYWCRNNRVPMEELEGMELRNKMTQLKAGYIYQPQVNTEVLEGNVCTIKGTGWAYSEGYRCQAQFDAIMRFEDASWKIQYYVWQGTIPRHQ